MLQHSLEVWWCICEFRVHYSGDVHPKSGLEDSFVLVFLYDADVLVPPPNVEL